MLPNQDFSLREVENLGVDGCIQVMMTELAVYVASRRKTFR
jgi:hypothetical protein